MHNNIAFTAPHQGAAEIGLNVLKQGGNAVDAMVAAAAAISVLYPHMNSLAGDGFWLIQRPGEAPRAIDASGTAAKMATPHWYQHQNFQSIPPRGGPAALTIGGTLDGWRLARQIISETHTPAELSELLAPAVNLAKNGIKVTESLASASRKVESDMSGLPLYKALFMPLKQPLITGQVFTNTALAETLERLANEGTDTFYRGELAAHIAASLEQQGSPIRYSDLANYHAQEVTPLSVELKSATLYNLPAPSQGIASLLILAIYDAIFDPQWTEAERIHGLIEATKRAFIIRDAEVTDPSRVSEHWPQLLSSETIKKLADDVTAQALPWPHVAEPGDTVWMGCTDADGTMVSFIQSVYWEFGSGVVIPGTGLVWNNRGASFSLEPNHINSLAPGLKPFHTLNPAMAMLNNGHRMSYGTMGGEGQPQTQAALLSRYLFDGMEINAAIAKDRWLLGRTWGETDHDLKMEHGLYQEFAETLQHMGHTIRPVPACNELMGHAGAIIRHSNGALEAASDPRSDGAGLISKVEAHH
ncbi:gamma-glutamyltransferase family protein [Echinimonas agarilytica]|uniref:Gamma-glutamyltransferase family protein n=1 Tax=Echinimonas agarilytica TaxID=1215918 RepID=A0AA41W6Z9_9GAMM|nr:gamma-glutamyltransferase family protein [Echinimonas agarilytica]MCM2680235.1 gamma-glutamyltransferase family protein [Echinimonas agarilytica]